MGGLGGTSERVASGSRKSMCAPSGGGARASGGRAWADGRAAAKAEDAGEAREAAKPDAARGETALAADEIDSLILGIAGGGAAEGAGLAVVVVGCGVPALLPPAAPAAAVVIGCTTPAAGGV